MQLLWHNNENFLLNTVSLYEIENNEKTFIKTNYLANLEFDITRRSVLCTRYYILASAPEVLTQYWI